MATFQTAHKIDKKPRTHDVLSGEAIDFPGLLLSEPVLKGLKEAGFERPSPIQLKTIPLGRCGLDLIVQAKSGTGKTCVFAVIALENIILDTNALQVLVIAPTREIAVQIWEVIKTIGSAMPQLRCYTFIGGLPVSDDIPKLKKCHIAVGTPGRLKQLIEKGHMNTDSVRLFVLDEADKLLDDSFQETINWIYSCLPDTKQMLALSATYPEVLAQQLTAYMCNPTFVRLNASDPALLGIRQYYRSLPYHPLVHKNHERKTKSLVDILSSVKFQQCLVFSNLQTRAESLCDQLNHRGWPSAFISGGQDQHHRLNAMAQLKQFKCRVLVSTDLTARGIDAENVNLVVNLDCPRDHETYLHRIGRAGRFGSYGAAITLCTEGEEMEKLAQIEDKCKTNIPKLPDEIPEDLAESSGFVDWQDCITTEKLITHPSKGDREEEEEERGSGEEGGRGDGEERKFGNLREEVKAIKMKKNKTKKKKVEKLDENVESKSEKPEKDAEIVVEKTQSGEMKVLDEKINDAKNTDEKKTEPIEAEKDEKREQNSVDDIVETSESGDETTEEEEKKNEKTESEIKNVEERENGVTEMKKQKVLEISKPCLSNVAAYLSQFDHKVDLFSEDLQELINAYELKEDVPAIVEVKQHNPAPSQDVVETLDRLLKCYATEVKCMIAGQPFEIKEETKRRGVGEDVVRMKEKRKVEDLRLGEDYIQSMNAVPSSSSEMVESGSESESESETDSETDSESETESDSETAANWMPQRRSSSKSQSAWMNAQQCFMASQYHMNCMQFYAAQQQQWQMQHMFSQQTRYIRKMAKQFTKKL